MAQFPILKLTHAGQDMAGMSQGGGKLIFVRVELGDGQLVDGDSIETLTAIKHSVMQLPLQSYLNEGGGKARLRFVVDNSSLEAGFINREIGVYAKMEGGEEQLYAYTNAGNYADWIPSKETPIDGDIVDLHIIIGNAPNVVIETINGAYATKNELEEHNKAPDAHANIRRILDDKAPIASPALTGTPTVPTASKGTSTDQIASTAFVAQAVADAVLAIGGHETPTITALIDWELMATENNGVSARNLQNAESGVIACGGDNSSKSGYGKSCILLKQVYTDFDKILVLGCDDACSFCTRQVFDKWELDLMFANSLTFNIVDNNGAIWRIFGGKKGTFAGELSAGKVWRTHSQNCGIVEIYGIKY